MMDINITYYLGNTQADRIDEVIHTLNQIQSYFDFHKVMSNCAEICDAKVIDWNSFRAKQRIRRIRCVIFITEKPFLDHWFSHEESQYSVLSMYDWEKWEKHFQRIPLELYLIYQIAQAVLNFAAGLNEKEELCMMHKETVGCMFDKCETKEHIIAGMAIGRICARCRAILSTKELNQEALQAVENMLDYVRNLISVKVPTFNE